LSVLGYEDAEVSVLLTSPGRMRELNVKWRKEDRAARILSFPQGENPGPKRVLGDLVLKAERRFPDYLLVHGVLHLMGYRHRTAKEATIMEKRHKEVMSVLKR